MAKKLTAPKTGAAFIEQVLTDSLPLTIADCKYVKSAQVTLVGGATIELPGDWLAYPLVVNEKNNPSNIALKDLVAMGVTDIKLVMDTARLTRDIDRYIDRCFKLG